MLTEWGRRYMQAGGLISPERGLTLVSVSSRVYGMARAEVIEFTDDFLGGDSTSIEHVWWNENSLRMTVQFTAKATGPGGIYSYEGVTRELFREFRDSPSLGEFFRDVFRRPAPEKPWPGSKHQDGNCTFKHIAVEPKSRYADPDVLKAARLTVGKGEEYIVHFLYSAAGDMPVRAESPDAAADLFEEWMREQGYDAKVTHVTMKRKK